tara:strand:- start:207 stop:608 length:402 start_codon:yes stop_codon:yes gene_type:complete
MKKILFTFFLVISLNHLQSKTLILSCSSSTSDSSFGSEVIIDTTAEFVSMMGWLIKGDFSYAQTAGVIEVFGVIKEYNKDADFRHVKYYEKEKILVWVDSFYRPGGVFWIEDGNPPHKYVSKGNMAVYKCKNK